MGVRREGWLQPAVRTARAEGGCRLLTQHGCQEINAATCGVREGSDIPFAGGATVAACRSLYVLAAMRSIGRVTPQ